MLCWVPVYRKQDPVPVRTELTFWGRGGWDVRLGFNQRNNTRRASQIGISGTENSQAGKDTWRACVLGWGVVHSFVPVVRTAPPIR